MVAVININAQTVITIKNMSRRDAYIRNESAKFDNKVVEIHKNGKTNLKIKLKSVKTQLKNNEISKAAADSLNINISEKNKKEIKEKVAVELKKYRKLISDYEKIREERTLSRSIRGKAITAIIIDEKVALKKEIEAINNRLEENKITKNEADKLKNETAEKHAKEIENKISEEELKVENQLQEFTDRQIANISVDSIDVELNYAHNPDKKRKTMKMTSERLSTYKKNIQESNKNRFYEAGVIAFGLNNVISNGKTSSDYKTWNSKFYEYGYTYKYRLTEAYSPFFFRWGASLLFNNLKTENNLYLVKTGNQTNLVTHLNNLKESRLKNVQLVFPVHFEIDFSKPSFIDGVKSYRHSNRKTFRLGLGGYGGVRVLSRQILKYEENGVSVKEKSTDHFNLNNFTYGLSGYLGYRSTSLYMKYDINTLFKNGNGRGISLGLRLEI